MSASPLIHSTTILAVRRDGRTAMAGDGQVTLQQTIMKASAKKVRRLMDGQILCGFAGSAADGLALLERFEAKLQEYGGQLSRAAVELAKLWRSDRVLRRFEAMMLAADASHIYLLSGGGDVIEPDEPVAAIGSGGAYALSAARVLLKHSTLSADAIARESMAAAAELCIYTNTHLTLEMLDQG